MLYSENYSSVSTGCMDMNTWTSVICSPAVSLTGSLWWLTVEAPSSRVFSGLFPFLDLDAGFTLLSSLSLRLLSNVRLPSPPPLLSGVIPCAILPVLGLCWRGQQNPCTVTEPMLRRLHYITLAVLSWSKTWHVLKGQHDGTIMPCNNCM